MLGGPGPLSIYKTKIQYGGCDFIILDSITRFESMGDLMGGLLVNGRHYFNTQIKYGRKHSPKNRIFCCRGPNISVSTFPTTRKHIYSKSNSMYSNSYAVYDVCALALHGFITYHDHLGHQYSFRIHLPSVYVTEDIYRLPHPHTDNFRAATCCNATLRGLAVAVNEL